ncbi:hypothetical protein D9757_012485 [Collybiopsis confluens]|uniref:Piwi-domain-containing protein n=1 Tax=Collybiopsis confluens TaxID=2823264 RepID=A0A8H5LPF3_9AGAR|nr:hypothetical protein D9757_012485 [Collybiopsis confluens]
MSQFQRGRGDHGGRGGDRGGRGRGGERGGRGAPGGGGPVLFKGPAPIDQRLSQQKNDLALVKTLSSLQQTPERPLRPGYGTEGIPVTLRANFFPVRLPKVPVQDYNIEITPKAEAKWLKERLFTLLEESAAFRPFRSHTAHDKSSRLLSAKPLPQPLTIAVPFFEEGASGPKAGDIVYSITITFTRELDPKQLTSYMEGQPQFRNYNPLPLVSALNAVLQQHASRTGVKVGQNKYFFPTSSKGVYLSPGISAFQGFFVSVRPTFNQLMVNVNACMTAFIDPGNLADALLSFNRNSRGAMPNLPRELMGKVKLTTRYMGYKKRHTIERVGPNTARKQTFILDQQGEISVEQYFLKQYNIKLKHATDVPVINVGKKRSNYIPAELCEIEPGQAFRGKLNEDQQAQMIRAACVPPRPNAEAIVGDGFKKLGLIPTSNGFGVEVSDEMAVVPARELRAPSVNYRVGTPKVMNGAWNILNVQFHRAATIRPGWSVLFNGPEDGRLRNLIQGFAQKMQKSGMSIPTALPQLLVAALGPTDSDPGRLQSLTKIRNILQEHLQKIKIKPAFVLVLLSRRDNYIYPGIKRIGDVELGVQTICMLLSKIVDKEPNKQDQYFSNVVLKLNTKLGGINHKARVLPCSRSLPDIAGLPFQLDETAMKWLRKKPTMMVGIDVTHNTGMESKVGIPSIAAVVASVDSDFVQFPGSLRLQKTDEVKEMLDELADMMVERLKFYQDKNKGVLPERVFIFRDGVSEVVSADGSSKNLKYNDLIVQGQYDTVLSEELPQILKAFQRFNTKERKTTYRPQLSIIICGKRHHARFFPTDSQFADRNGNTRPGTVVDRGVTSVFDFDFYLQAHAGLQGSVKATHYTIVYDENRFTADEIQQGTHNTSYLYARATKAVSLMPPAYYADLAAERGRCYLNDFLIGSDKASSAGAGARSRNDKKVEMKMNYDAAVKAWGNGLHPDMRGTMFYI